MKILFVVPYFSNLYGGTTSVAAQLAKALSSKGLTIDIITTDAAAGDKLNVTSKSWVSYDGYRVQYFPCWHRRDFVISLPLLKWLIKNIRNYDLAHMHTVFAPIISFASLICFQKKVPYIITSHGMLLPWAINHKVWRKKVYLAILEKKNLLRASGIQAVCLNELNSIKYLVPQSKVFLIPNGIEIKDFENLADPEIFFNQFPHVRGKNIILFLGRIDKKKGFDILAPAFALVNKQLPQTHLVIGGPDFKGLLNSTKALFSDAGCLQAVTFTGMLDDQIKKSALAAAKVFVLPSYCEGFSMAILEAMASGLPCVITPGCNAPEVAQEGAGYVVKSDPCAIAEALLACLMNPQSAKAMGKTGRELVLNNYTWDKIANQIIGAYQSIIDNYSSL